ncbi:hypothetical protein M405DRAFT_844476 [Rhizopogon salebrosus TDB-379]|nr:hypothetical protein M405DRAFT_844476 [Rhizopogon salebrosus TDB-379]
MYGHVNYDSRIQTLWVANRCENLIALCIVFDIYSSPSSGELVHSGFFEQVIEFSSPKLTIHFVILSADADPTGDEAHGALHLTGVDQVLIRKEWYDTAVVNTPGCLSDSFNIINPVAFVWVLHGCWHGSECSIPTEKPIPLVLVWVFAG